MGKSRALDDRFPGKNGPPDPGFFRSVRIPSSGQVALASVCKKPVRKSDGFWGWTRGILVRPSPDLGLAGDVRVQKPLEDGKPAQMMHVWVPSWIGPIEPPR